MAIPERDTVYSSDGTNRTTYTRESSATGWFLGIIVALALMAIVVRVRLRLVSVPVNRGAVRQARVQVPVLARPVSVLLV